MADILVSQFMLPNDQNTYVIKDAWAREMIENLGEPMHFAGVTTSPITDGSTTNPIVINGQSYTAEAGDVVVYNDKEFVWDGAKWVEFGDLTDLGNMAYANTASMEYQPAGTISKPSITVSAGTVSVALDTLTSTGEYTPEASLVKDANGVKIEGTVTGSFAGDTLTSTGEYTPAGELINMSFVGTEETLTVSGQTITAEGVFTPSVTIDAHTALGSFAGTAATITVSANLPALVQGNISTTPVLASGALSGGEVSYDKMVITPPQNDNETMVFAYATVTAAVSGMTFNGTTVNVVSDVANPAYSAQASQTPFSMSGDYTPAGSVTVEVRDHNLTIPQNQTISVQGEVAAKSITYTPAGTVSGAFQGTTATLSVSGTPTGSLTNLAFAGESYRIQGVTATLSVEGTPSGTVELSGITAELADTPTFLGTTATITVTPDPIVNP